MARSILNSFKAFANAIKELVLLTYVSNDTVLLAGKRYHLLTDATLTLPDVTGKTEPFSIQVHQAVGVTSTFVVDPANVGTTIKMGESTGTTMAVSSERTVIVYYDPVENNWII